MADIVYDGGLKNGSRFIYGQRFFALIGRDSSSFTISYDDWSLSVTANALLFRNPASLAVWRDAIAKRIPTVLEWIDKDSTEGKVVCKKRIELDGLPVTVVYFDDCDEEGTYKVIEDVLYEGKSIYKILDPKIEETILPMLDEL